MQFNIKNKTQEFQRIRLIPRSPQSNIVLGLEEVNPTLSIAPDKILSVCLAPTVTSKCEGALFYCDTGGVWGDFTLTVNGTSYQPYSPELDNILLVDNQGGELHFVWTNLTSDFLQVEIKNARLFPSDYGWGSFNATREVDFDTGSVSFCLSPDNVCQPTQPHTFLFEQGLWLLDGTKDYKIYLKQDNEIFGIPAKIYDDISNPGKVALTVSDLLTNLQGFHTENLADFDLNPSTCKSYQYEGTYYVRQLVQSWENYHVIGSFYVEKDGVRDYLQGSQRTFQHKGSQLTLKEVIKPYYESVAAFLRSYGLNAVYDPNFWGSYNSGGVKVIRDNDEYDKIKFGSETGYDLLFDGYSDSVCTEYKSFEELENGPAKVIISANTIGEPMINEITILCSHEPDDPSTEVNLMQYFGFFDDVVLKSCLGSVPG